MVYKSGIPPYKMDSLAQALISRRNNIVQHLADTNQLYDHYGNPTDFKGAEREYSLRKADTIYEDNPVGAPVTDLPVNEALEILKKHPLLFAEGNLEGEKDNDS